MSHVQEECSQQWVPREDLLQVLEQKASGEAGAFADRPPRDRAVCLTMVRTIAAVDLKLYKEKGWLHVEELALWSMYKKFFRTVAHGPLVCCSLAYPDGTVKIRLEEVSKEEVEAVREREERDRASWKAAARRRTSEETDAAPLT